MSKPDKIFVTGGTGNQGGAVARHLAHHGYHVTVLARNPESAKVQELRNLGITVIKGDLTKPESYRHHLTNTDGVFSVQGFKDGVRSEIEQGKALASAAKEAGVRHFLYTSVAFADSKSGVPHFESKRVIEKHIKHLGLAYTILRPVSLYENFLIPQIKKGILKGKLVQAINPETTMQYVASDDIGKAALEIFRDPELYMGKTITLASETLSGSEVAHILSEVLNKEIRYEKLPPILTRIFVGKDLSKMFRWMNGSAHFNPDDIETSRKLVPNMLDLKSWAVRHFT